MSGRCRSCNVILNEDEMTTKWPGTTEYTDLCFTCLNKCSGEEEDDIFWSDSMISIDTIPEELL